jgi:6-phosphogluconate dehydrogenase
VGGARKKDSQGLGVMGDQAAQNRREKVSHFNRQEAQTQEQKATIESVKHTIGQRSLDHHYEVPTFPTNLERPPRQQEDEQRK